MAIFHICQVNRSPVPIAPLGNILQEYTELVEFDPRRIEIPCLHSSNPIHVRDWTTRPSRIKTSTAPCLTTRFTHGSTVWIL